MVQRKRKKKKSRCVIKASSVYPRDHVADRSRGGGGGLAAAAQDHERGSDAYHELRKDQNSKFEIWFLLDAYCFYIIVKSKNC